MVSGGSAARPVDHPAREVPVLMEKIKVKKVEEAVLVHDSKSQIGDFSVYVGIRGASLATHNHY